MQNKYWDNEQWNNLAPEVTLESIGASPEVLTDTTAPTTSIAGAVGQFYLNTNAKALYQCIAASGSVYTWAPVLKNWKLLQAYTTAGSYTFTTPSGITELGAFVIGGGGSGASFVNMIPYSGANNAYVNGGASGHAASKVYSAPLSTSYSVVVGAGGAASVLAASGNIGQAGNNGSSSSFNAEVIALGGGKGALCGNNTPTQSACGAAGGQGSNLTFETSSNPLPAKGEVRLRSGYGVTTGSTCPSECTNPFDGKRLLLAGGSVYGSDSVSYPETLVNDDYGNPGSVGVLKLSDTAIATKGTSYGCGGGGALICYTVAGSCTATSAAGCDGAVLIYGR